MIIILIKRPNGSQYQASSFDSKLEKEISSGSENVSKKLSKEFGIKQDQIYKFWITNENPN